MRAQSPKSGELSEAPASPVEGAAGSATDAEAAAPAATESTEDSECWPERWALSPPRRDGLWAMSATPPPDELATAVPAEGESEEANEESMEVVSVPAEVETEEVAEAGTQEAAPGVDVTRVLQSSRRQSGYSRLCRSVLAPCSPGLHNVHTQARSPKLTAAEGSSAAGPSHELVPSAGDAAEGDVPSPLVSGCPD